VLGGNTFLSARDDIGKQSNRIASQVGNIEAQSTTGSTWIDNQGDLSVGGSFTTNPQGIFAGGSATITASSPITVKKSALVGGSLQYIATDDSSGDDLVVEAVDLNGQPLYLKATGDIRLLAGDNLTVEHGALLQAGGSIVLKGDVHTASSASELDGAKVTFLRGGGIHRAPGGLAVTQITDSAGSLVTKDGKPPESSGTGVFKFASGTLAALSGKHFKFTSKPTGLGRFDLEYTD